MNRLNSVSSVRRSVSDAQRDHGGFLVSLEGGRTCRAKALLLASDFTARPPDLADVKRFYGSSLHQCPYCGGWEHRGRRIGVIGRDDAAAAMAVKLLSWTQRVTLYTHGTHLPQSAASKVAGLPVDVVTGTVRSLEGRGRHLESIRMENGFCYPCQALFFPSQVESHLHLANRVGGEFTDVAPFHDLASHQPGIQGLFRIRGAGDGIEMAVCSAAEGVRAAESVNQWLTQADHSYLAVRQSA